MSISALRQLVVALAVINSFFSLTINAQQVKDRMALQMDEEEKLRLCDYVIINDEQQMLIPQVLELHQKFLQENI